MQMRNIVNVAPACFNHPMLLGDSGQPGFEYIALGRPDLSEIAPKSKPIDWNEFKNFGAKAALQIAPDLFLEVRALRGAYFKDFSREKGLTSGYAAGSFLFPADKPMLLGAYKCYREAEWIGDNPNITREEFSVASIGRKGALIVYNNQHDNLGVSNHKARIAFLSCLGIAYAYEKGTDDLSKILKSIDGVAHHSRFGVRALFRNIFGTGKPGKFEGTIVYYMPESVTVDYDEMLPLRRPKAIPRNASYIGYNLQRSRFVELR